jgi:hypothetical protein
MDLYGTYDLIIKYSETKISIGMVFVSHGIVFSIYWDNHSSRTYVQIRRMVLVSLCGVSELFNIMLDYSYGVWLQEIMQLMLSYDTDSDDVACELIYVIMR